ncbi:MAG: hypothetical protein EOO16_16400 [Chitinophagaceae bacterium]|nr:MAG: hypothetical protein EOO16_16400 [Chitinophagaceae bacterium]
MMTTHRRNTGAFASGLLFFFLWLAVSDAAAQPGWRDISRRYSYRLLDASGRPIVFTGSKVYSVGVNGRFFSGPSIPHDSLEPLRNHARDYYDAVRINDFSFKIPQDQARMLHIQVVRGRDTMHLWPEKEVVIRFRPGYYFFPSWHAAILDTTVFRASGALRVVNRDPGLLQVPSTAFLQALSLSGPARGKELETLVRAQVTDPFFRVESREEVTSLVPSMEPFRRNYWDGPLHRTSDSGVYLGLVSGTFDTTNLSWSRYAAARLETDKNRIVLWSPRADQRLHYAGRLFRDPFSGHFYLTGGLRDSTDQERGDDFLRYSFTHYLFRSADDGQTWDTLPGWRSASSEGSLKQLEFPNAEHMIVFYLRYTPGRTDARTQGVYYLLQHGALTDSFVTPPENHFSDNYNGWHYERIHDSLIRLGHWGVSGSAGNAPVTQLLLARQGGRWRFRNATEPEQQYWKRVRQPRPAATDTIRLGKMRLLQGRRLLTPKGSLWLRKRPLAVLAREKFAVLFLEQGALYSVDGGARWYYDPPTRDQQFAYSLLDGNELGQLWFWDLSRLKKQTLEFRLR